MASFDPRRSLPARAAMAALALAVAAGGVALDLRSAGAGPSGPAATSRPDDLLDDVYQNVSDSPTVASSSAAVATSGSDTYVAWREGDQIAFRVVREHGFVQDPEPIVFEVAGGGRAGSDDPSVAAVGDSVYVTWAQGVPDPDRPDVLQWEVFVATSHDRGRTFGPPEQWSDRGGEVAYAPRLAASDEVVAVVWEGPGREVVLAARRRGGGAVELDTVGTAFNGEYEVAVVEETVHVAWIEDAVYATRKPSMGDGLEARRLVGGKDHQPHHPDLVAAGDHVAVGWIEYRGNAKFDPVFVGESTDGGASWRRAPVSGLSESCGQHCGGPGPKLGLNGGRVHAFFAGGRSGIWEAMVENGRLLQVLNVGGGPISGTVADALVTGRAVHVAWTEWVDGEYRTRVVDGTRRHGSDEWSVRTSDLGGIAWEPRLASLDGDFVTVWNEVTRLTSSEVVVRPGSLAGTDVAVLGVEAVQAVAGAERLVTGKPTAYRARVRNDFATAQDVVVRWEVANADRAVHVWEEHVTLRPGVQVLTYVPTHFDLQQGDVSVTATIDVDEAVEESDEDNNERRSRTYEAVPTRPHHVLWVPLHDPVTGERTSCRDAELLAATSQPFVDAVWPADPDASEAAVACTRPVEFHGGGRLHTADLVARARQELRSSLAAGWDQIVVVAPPDWIATNLYDAHDDTRGTSIILGGEGVIVADAAAHGGAVVAHELAHDLRWVRPSRKAEEQHLQEVDAPGFWVARRMELLNRHDFMNDKVASDADKVAYWISEQTWDHLLTVQLHEDPTQPVAAAGADGAQVLAVDGVVAADGSVEVGPVRLVDGRPTVPLGSERPEEAVELHMLDERGRTVGRTDLPLSVVADGDPDRSGTRSFGGFVALADGTTEVELRRDGRTVARRAASPHAPTIQLGRDVVGPVVPGGTVDVQWTVTDADGDPVAVDLEVSGDGGRTWLPGPAGATGGTAALTLPGAAFDDVLVRATATDGWHATTVTSAPVPATGGTTNGRLAFGRGAWRVHDGAPGTDLWSSEADGSDARLLVDADELPVEWGQSIRFPTWSPDGTRLAFAQDAGPALWVVDGDGRSLRSLGLEGRFPRKRVGSALETTHLLCPTWAPGGDRLLFVETGYGLDAAMPLGTRLWTVPVDEPGADPQLVGPGTHPGDCALDWTAGPDGERLWALTQGGDLESMRPDGSDRHVALEAPSTTPLQGADVSPDGTLVAFHGHDGRHPQIHVGDLEDGTTRRLTELDGLPGPARRPMGLAWAPDGRRLVVDVAEWRTDWDLRRLAVVDALAGDVELLPVPDGLADREATWQPVHRDVTPVPTEPLPVLDARLAAPATAPEGLMVTVDAGGSVVDATPATYAWDLDGDGTFTDATGPTATFTPLDDGPHAVRVEVTDAMGRAEVATAVVEVTEVAPVVEATTGAQRAAGATVEATVRTAPGEGLRARVRWADGVESGAVALAAGGGSWTVRSDRVGVVPGASATVTVVDDDGSSTSVEVALAPAPANQAPTATGTAVSTPRDVPVEVGLGATDPDGPTADLQAQVVRAPERGRVTTLPARGPAGPSVRYAPAPGFVGTETFTVRVSDGEATSAPVAITVTVTGPCPHRTVLGQLVCLVVTVVKTILGGLLRR